MTNIKLTFKEYLKQSKDQLVEAAASTPSMEITYDINSYCKIPLEELYDRPFIALKPKHKVVVRWLYEDLNNPTVLGVKFIGVEGIDSSTSYQVSWKSEKVQTWIVKNTH